jgi:hypothetical protein
MAVPKFATTRGFHFPRIRLQNSGCKFSGNEGEQSTFSRVSPVKMAKKNLCKKNIELWFGASVS